MSEDSARRAKTQAAVEGVWQRMRPMVLARFVSIERALESLGHGTLDVSLRLQAAAEAHKLAGSLGMFGFPEGSVLAREFETAIKNGVEDDAAARYAERLLAFKERLEA